MNESAVEKLDWEVYCSNACAASKVGIVEIQTKNSLECGREINEERHARSKCTG